MVIAKVIAKAIREMPYRKRHFGMSCLDILYGNIIMKLFGAFIAASIVFTNIGNFGMRKQSVQLPQFALEYCRWKLEMLWTMDARVDPTNKNRNIDTFTDEECYRDFRLTKEKLKKFLRLLRLPIKMTFNNGISCPGDHAFLIMIYRLHHPCILAQTQARLLIYIIFRALKYLNTGHIWSRINANF